MKYLIHTILSISIFLGGQAFYQESDRSNSIEALIKSALHDNPTMAQDIHSIVISQNGKPIYSQYFNQYTADSLNNLKSVTKSIIGLLVGIAIDEGHIPDINQPMIDYFSDCQLDKDRIEEKKSITIKNLLLMQAGIEWNNRALIKDEWWYNEKPHCFFLNIYFRASSHDLLAKPHYNMRKSIYSSRLT
uniref:serine hydrolase n=1 Tax=Fulvivirga sp. TaxID=1931237 RepID=UPI004048F512